MNLKHKRMLALIVYHTYFQNKVSKSRQSKPLTHLIFWYCWLRFWLHPWLSLSWVSWLQSARGPQTAPTAISKDSAPKVSSDGIKKIEISIRYQITYKTTLKSVLILGTSIHKHPNQDCRATKKNTRRAAPHLQSFDLWFSQFWVKWLWSTKGTSKWL